MAFKESSILAGPQVAPEIYMEAVVQREKFL